MNLEVIAKDVPHSYEVMFVAVHCQAVHAKILRQQRFPMPLDDVLKSRIKVLAKTCLKDSRIFFRVYLPGGNVLKRSASAQLLRW